MAPLSLLTDCLLSILSEKSIYGSEKSWFSIMGLSMNPTQLCFFVSDFGWIDVADPEGGSAYLTMIVTS